MVHFMKITFSMQQFRIYFSDWFVEWKSVRCSLHWFYGCWCPQDVVLRRNLWISRNQERTERKGMWHNFQLVFILNIFGAYGNSSKYIILFWHTSHSHQKTIENSAFYSFYFFVFCVNLLQILIESYSFRILFFKIQFSQEVERGYHEYLSVVLLM